MNFTFRTESTADDERVPALLAEMGIRVDAHRTIEEPGMPGYAMGVFHITSDRRLDDLRAQMTTLVRGDTRFVDMHRCFQTLAAGDKPDEQWFMRED